MRADRKTNRFGNNRRRKVGPLPFSSDPAGRSTRFAPDFTVFNFVPEKLFNLQSGALRRFFTSARAPEFRSISTGMHARRRGHAFTHPHFHFDRSSFETARPKVR